MTQPSQEPAGGPAPWWRERMLWLVIGGPLLVVLASFLTLALALRQPDPVIVIEPSASATAAEAPALQARNRGATARP